MFKFYGLVGLGFAFMSWAKRSSSNKYNTLKSMISTKHVLRECVIKPRLSPLGKLDRY